MTGFALHLHAFGSSDDSTDSMAQTVPVDLQAESDERLVKLHVDGQPWAIDELPFFYQCSMAAGYFVDDK